MKGAHLRRTPLRPRLEFALFLLAMCLFGVGIGLAVSNAQAGRVISSDYFYNNDGPPDDSGCRCKPYKDYDDGNPAHTCRKPSFVAGPAAENRGFRADNGIEPAVVYASGDRADVDDVGYLARTVFGGLQQVRQGGVRGVVQAWLLSRSRRRATSAMEAPCSASRRAVAAPMPLHAPVTRAAVPLSDEVMGLCSDSLDARRRRRRARASPHVLHASQRRQAAVRLVIDGAAPTCRCRTLR